MIRRRRAGRLRVGLRSQVETGLFDRLRHLAVIVSAGVVLGVAYLWVVAQSKSLAGEILKLEHRDAELRDQILTYQVTQTRLVGDQDQLLADLQEKKITMRKATERQKRRLGEAELLAWLAPLERHRGGSDEQREPRWARQGGRSVVLGEPRRDGGTTLETR